MDYMYYVLCMWLSVLAKWCPFSVTDLLNAFLLCMLQEQRERLTSQASIVSGDDLYATLDASTSLVSACSSTQIACALYICHL